MHNYKEQSTQAQRWCINICPYGSCLIYSTNNLEQTTPSLMLNFLENYSIVTTGFVYQQFIGLNLRLWGLGNSASKPIQWKPQNKEGILPSSDTVYCSICSPQIYVSQRRCARGGSFVIGFININKYTSVSENVHLCLRTFNWVTLVSLLVEYLLYSVVKTKYIGAA